jgi:hypothetical protein
MHDHKSEKAPAMPWRVPVAVEDIPEDGQTFTLDADAETRAAIAKLAGLRDLPRLAATFEVTRQGIGGLRVIGHVSAMAGQACVVTLEPLLNPIEENVDLSFMPQVASPGPSGEKEPADARPAAKWNDPEPLVDGIVDLGALATEFFILGLDPYPRKSGAVFEPAPERDADGGPFAALAGWSKDQNRH